MMTGAKILQQATFGAGCFWCTEAIFQRMNGVESVVSGYAGGDVQNPSYEQVCSGSTGHAEVIQITFDPTVISYTELLEVFFRTHDPTTLNRQGNDLGTQYRSVIFSHNEEQQLLADQFKANLNASSEFPDPVVTEISLLSEFHPAEDYHQNYYRLNASQPYCNAIIRPKLEKLEKLFSKKLNAES